MATEIVRLTPERMPAFRRFAETVWQRPRSDAYYRWRYESSSPFHDVWLAVREGECLAMEAVIRRPWRVGDEIVEIGEVFDWYALPQYRNAGLGVRVMQALMKEPHPLLLVGGSQDTQALLPRLKWQAVGSAQRYMLPLSNAQMAPGIARRLRVPMPLAEVVARTGLARIGRRPRRRGVPRDARATAVGGIGEEILELYQQGAHYRTVPQWSISLLRWLTGGFSGAGHFIPLYFERGNALVGWLLLRVFPRGEACEANIVECFAPVPDAELYTWMVSEAAVVATAFAPNSLGAQATCPLLVEALRRNRFVPTRVNPIHVWWPGHDRLLPGPMSIGYNTNDGAIGPLPSRWWQDPPRDDADPERR